MIRVGFKYKVYQVKTISEQKMVFSIMDREKNGKNHFASVMVTRTPELEEMIDKDTIQIDKITGISLSEYKEKMQVTMYADVSRVYPEQQFAEPGVPDLVASGVITSDDLPF